jgi:FixJ family two-component response regulator
MRRMAALSHRRIPRHYAGVDCQFAAKHAHLRMRCVASPFTPSKGGLAMMTERNGSELFIVDDDVLVRDALTAVFTIEGYRVTRFAEGQSFLAAARAQAPSCVLLDVHTPGRSGLDILRDLDAQRYGAPIFVISAQGDIPMAVEAIRKGAFDFIEKPFDPETVVARVRAAIESFSRRNGGNVDGHRMLSIACCDRLTPRERDVLAQIAGGASNKEAGRQLGISPRTIEVHRARIMEKLGARNTADLVRIVLTEASVR